MEKEIQMTKSTEQEVRRHRCDFGETFPSNTSSSYLRLKHSLWSVQTGLAFSSFYTVYGGLFFHSNMKWVNIIPALKICMLTSFLERAILFFHFTNWKLPVLTEECLNILSITVPGNKWLPEKLNSGDCFRPNLVQCDDLHIRGNKESSEELVKRQHQGRGPT